MDWRQLWEICSAPDNVPIVGLIPLLVFYIYLAWKQAKANDELIGEETATADFERQSPDTAWDSSWRPLPNAGQPAAGTIEEVRALYAFAAKRSDILQYIPCYCGCEREGHRSNEDCYVRGRTATGPPQWDGHAYT